MTFRCSTSTTGCSSDAPRVTRVQTETLLASCGNAFRALNPSAHVYFGFTGETEAEFQNCSISFVRSVFPVGVFPPLEPDTPGGRMKSS